MSNRSDIRTALKTIASNLDGIDTVYVGRRRSVPESALPAALIYVEREEKEPDAIGEGTYVRTLSLITEIHVQANSAEAAEVLLDTMCAAREAAILADDTLGGLVEKIDFESDEYQADEDAVRPAAIAICRDIAVYTE